MRNSLSGTPLPEKTDVAIIGGGVGGIFSAAKLCEESIDFAIFERGKRADERFCRNDCSECSPETCDIIHGVGGAALFSEGKLTFSYSVGGNVERIFTKEKYTEKLEELKSIIKLPETAPNYEKEEEFNRLASPLNIKILSFPQVSIGVDRLPGFVEGMTEGFSDRIFTCYTVGNIKRKEGYYHVEVGESIIEARNVIVSTGQKGSSFAVEMAKKLGIACYPGNADIGVRLECPKEVLQPLIEIQHSPKLYFETDYGTVRTFCANPEGYIIILNNGKYISSNGNAGQTRRSPNTNIALMYSLGELTDPRGFTMELCKKFWNAAKDNLVIQDVSEIIDATQSSVNPTCKRVIKDDIRQFFPSNIYNALKESLKNLSKILCGFEGVVYAPEVKLYNFRIDTQKDTFEALPGLYFVGDCAGWTHGVVNSALGGLAAADVIAAKMQGT